MTKLNYKKLYFKCDMCNNIFLKKNNIMINNDKINNLLKNSSYFLDRKFCNSCFNYIKWENSNY
jgi:hypothetical protein